MKAVRKLFFSNYKEFFRDWIEVMWTFLFPMIVLLGLGLFTLQAEKKETYHIGVVAESHQVESQALKALKNIDNFTLHYGTIEEEEKAFLTGNRDGVITIVEQVELKALSDIALKEYVLTSDSQLLYSLLGILRSDGTSLNMDIQEESKGSLDGKIAIVLAITIMQVNIFSVARVIRLKNTGALKVLNTTPLSKYAFLLGEIGFKVTLTLLQLIFLMAAARLIFKVEVKGNYLLMLAWVFLGCGIFIALGYSIARFLKKAESASNILQLLTFGLIIISGLFMPVSALPAGFRHVVKVSPLNLLIDALNGIILNTPITTAYMIQILGLAGYFVLFFVMAARFKWES